MSSTGLGNMEEEEHIGLFANGASVKASLGDGKWLGIKQKTQEWKTEANHQVWRPPPSSQIKFNLDASIKARIGTCFGRISRQ